MSFQTSKGDCLTAVKMAIDTGYRHIDGAYIYKNEHEVGEAIREKIAEGKVQREDIFYCGKVRPSLHLHLLILMVDLMPLFSAKEFWIHQEMRILNCRIPYSCQEFRD